MNGTSHPDISSLEERLGLHFRSPRLLQEALVHRSFLNELPQAGLRHNERLEFLGDAFLGMVVAHHLFTRFRGLSEGQLTEQRADLVRRETLARVALSLGLGDALLMGQGEERSGGRERASTLAGALEAVIGAVFEDQGYRVARAFTLRALRAEVNRLTANGVPRDPKSALQESVQARGHAPPTYETVAEEGPEHSRWFAVEVRVNGRVLGHGEGSRKVDAQRAAAREALGRLAELPAGGPAKLPVPSPGDG